MSNKDQMTATLSLRIKELIKHPQVQKEMLSRDDEDAKEWVAKLAFYTLMTPVEER